MSKNLANEDLSQVNDESPQKIKFKKKSKHGKLEQRKGRKAAKKSIREARRQKDANSNR